MKVCYVCRKTKDIHAFPFVQYKKSSGYLKKCQDCYSALHAPETQHGRWCPSCSTYKSLDEFHFTGTTSGLRRRQCKTCAKRYLLTPEGRTRRQHVRRKCVAGFTQVLWDSTLVLQENRCAICLISFSTINPPCADHCHKTNTPRGILCNHCNAGLGMFRDYPDRLRRAADYLDAPPLHARTEWEDLV